MLMWHKKRREKEKERRIIDYLWEESFDRGGR